MSTHPNQTNSQVFEIVDRILNQIFGKQATLMIYKYLERNYSLRRDEVGEKVEVFAQGLEDFLRSGAYAIEKRILEDIYSSRGLIRKESIKHLDEDDFVSEMKFLTRKA